MSTKSKKIASNEKLINPELQSVDLVNLKKKKQQQQQLKKLKLTVEKELKLMLKKDEALIKNCFRKKQQLTQQINKQQILAQNRQYKQWLNEQKQRKLEQKKLETQNLKNTIKSSTSLALQRNLQNKKYIANNTKKTITEWKLQKSLSQQKLLQQRRDHFQATQRQKNSSRESNRAYFEKRHSRIVQKFKNELERSQSQFDMNKKSIEQIEKEIISIRQNSQSKQKIIERLQDDILNIRNESLCLSRTRSKIGTPRHSTMSVKQGKYAHGGSPSDQSTKMPPPKKYERKLSLPLLFVRRSHNQK